MIAFAIVFSKVDNALYLAARRKWIEDKLDLNL
jgi:hypothetical protein